MVRAMLSNLSFIKQSLCICLIVTSTTLIGQKEFPDLCIGEWEGMMMLYNSGELRDSVHVDFVVDQLANAAGYTWRKSYTSPKYNTVKDYKLLHDTLSSQFLLDEGDGLVLKVYSYGTSAYSMYQLEDVMFESSYQLVDDSTMIFEVAGGKVVDTTANEIVNYSYDFVQRVVFKRTNSIVKP